MRVKWPLKCPKNHGHNIFTAYVEIKGKVLIDNQGTILNLEEVLGCELPITLMKPDVCNVCDTPLIGSKTWHSQETEQELKLRILENLGYDEEEKLNFDLEDYRCGLCNRLYDKCNCAETGMR